LDPTKRYDTIAQSVALATLRNIEREQKSASSPNGLTRAHRSHILFLIEKALDA